MPFSPVSWASLDELTSAKLAQMVENLATHDHRQDGSQGAPRARWATGTLSIACVANTTTYVNQLFPVGLFDPAGPVPSVIVNPISTNGSSVLRSYGVRFPANLYEAVDVFAHRTAAATVAFEWVAVQAPTT